MQGDYGDERHKCKETMEECRKIIMSQNLSLILSLAGKSVILTMLSVNLQGHGANIFLLFFLFRLTTESCQ